MKILRTRADLRLWRLALGTRSVGFVPTMGALHEGHLRLVRQARAENEVVIASVFVNPLQFGPHEDMAQYPRPFERDCELLQGEKVDALFAPSPEEMYPEDRSVIVAESSVSRDLCGAARPGHFDGVCTVVLKLFHLVQPERAYFGEKDAQQLRVIERMVRDLDVPVAIVRVPTVREPDGLALSSRNAYLTPPERAVAPLIYRSLEAVRAQHAQGETRVSVLEAVGRSGLERAALSAPTLRVQYWEIRHGKTLRKFPHDTVPHGAPALALVAAYLGATRLIDNLELGR